MALSLYRSTIKRLPGVHRGLHRLAHDVVFPLLESARGFKTIADDPFWFRLELLLDRHEPETTIQIDRLVQPGMTVLDVGGHIGYYVRRCAKRVGPSGKVVAFEPHPRTYQVLQHNIKGFKNVEAIQAACSDATGTAELYDYLMMSASGSLHYDEALRDVQMAQVGEGDVAPRIDGDFAMQSYVVRKTTIDTVTQDLGIDHVDVVKMDIEGAEMDALRGAKATIARSPKMALIMEFNPQALRAFDHDPAQVPQMVLDLGFDTVQTIAEDGTLAQLDDAAALAANLQDRMAVVNLLFLRGFNLNGK